MKTIVFLSLVKSYFTGDELDRRAVGGADTAVINMARLFVKMGHKVIVKCACERPGIFNGVTYMDIRKSTPNDLKTQCPIDLLIMVRNPRILDGNDPHDFGAKKVVLWCHDKGDDSVNESIDKYIPKIDKVIALSEWHKKDLQKKIKIPDDKFFITRNGIDPELFKTDIKKVPGRCIYSSTPFRGLSLLLSMWPEIERKVPYASLRIFSSMDTYGPGHDDEPYSHLYDVARSLKSVEYMGSVKQSELAKEMLSSEVLLYPNNFDETCCITAIEAQHSETAIITSSKGALPETVKSGILIEGNPYSAEYQNEFIQATVELLGDKHKRLQMTMEAKQYDWSWQGIAEAWSKTFLEEC